VTGVPMEPRAALAHYIPPPIANVHAGGGFIGGQERESRSSWALPEKVP